MSNEFSLKVFLSHSNKDKSIAAVLKQKLSSHGIHIFVAHEDIDGGVEWMAKLYEEIQNCAIFFILFSKNYHESEYTDQEIGIALRSDKIILPICIDKVRPYGFTSKYQAVVCDSSLTNDMIDKIIETIKKHVGIKSLILDELIRRLTNASSYMDAYSIARDISNYNEFSNAQINNIAAAYLSNPEIHDSFMAAPIVIRLLRNNIKQLDEVISQQIPF